MKKTEKIEIVEETAPEFTDYIQPALFPEAEKIELDKILGKPIIIRDFQSLPSKFGAGDFGIVLADFNGKQVSFSCSSTILRQLVKAKESGLRFPIRVKITQAKGKQGQQYYTLATP